MNYFKQIYSDMREQPLATWLSIGGTALSLFMVMAVFTLGEIDNVPNPPESCRKSLMIGDDIAARRKTMVSTGDRSAKIRTYNYPQGRITDHRINYTIYNLSAFMDGDIQGCIDSLIVAENAEKLKAAQL